MIGVIVISNQTPTPPYLVSVVLSVSSLKPFYTCPTIFGVHSNINGVVSIHTSALESIPPYLVSITTQSNFGSVPPLSRRDDRQTSALLESILLYSVSIVATQSNFGSFPPVSLRDDRLTKNSNHQKEKSRWS